MTALVGFVIGVICGAVLTWLALMLIANREKRDSSEENRAPWAP